MLKYGGRLGARLFWASILSMYGFELKSRNHMQTGNCVFVSFMFNQFRSVHRITIGDFGYNSILTRNLWLIPPCHRFSLAGTIHSFSPPKSFVHIYTIRILFLILRNKIRWAQRANGNTTTNNNRIQQHEMCFKISWLPLLFEYGLRV